MAGWLLALTLGVGSQVLDVAARDGLVAAAVLTALMAALVYAAWEFMPGHAETAQPAEPPRRDDVNNGSNER